MKKGSNGLLHLLQHIFFTAGAVAFAMMSIGSHVIVEDTNGIRYYSVFAETDISFEDSSVFNQLLGNNIHDVICYGAIRGQMETGGKYDADKVIDVTAFANRYEGLKQEYISAEYYLEDLIKWSRHGFETEEVYMTGQEADEFLSRVRTVTYVDFGDGNYNGGTISYLNSDIKKNTHVMDVSGNVTQQEDGTVREDVSATVMKNRYRTVGGQTIENHVSSWEEYYDLCANVQKTADDLRINYEEYIKYKEYYDAGNTNIVYYIRSTIGDEVRVFSNRDVVSSQPADLEKALKEECGKYIIYDPENMIFDTNTLIEEETVRYVLNGYEYAYPYSTQVYVGVADSYFASDAFAQAKAGFDNYSPNFLQYLCITIISFILFFVLLVITTIKEGKVKIKETKEVVIRLKQQDALWTEGMLLLAAVITVCFIKILSFGISEDVFRFREYIYSPWMPVISGLIAVIVSMVFSFFYYSFIRRWKARTLWKNSFTRRLFIKTKELLLYLYDNSAVVVRVWIPFILFIAFNVLVIFVLEDWGFLLAGIVDLVVGLICYKSALDRQRILKGIEKINSGDMEHQIDVNGLHGDNLILANAINSIGEGIRNAVETSMKDERLKADLITNVSHDIKTPLTSIINYVDLIKRENIDNPKVIEYIEILDSKSQRLKQLTDDLVEASKISSGNIVLQWEKINLVELLHQTIGEFSEKFEQKNLMPVFRSSENSIFIEADSRRIWRVIENLFNNIFKYALSGTRIYIDIHLEEKEKGKKQVSLSILNISENPIKVNTDELTERFIRGDESRTTEGSGLGLSIAKNLTEVQKGKFEIAVDGDLFKVILTFPLLEEK